MAVIPQVPGLKVTIEVNEHSLIEYQQNNAAAAAVSGGADNQPRIEKHVESTTGATFKILISFATLYKPGRHALAYDIILDGKRIIRQLLRRGNIRGKVIVEEGVREQTRSVSTVRRFAFAELQRVEEKPDDDTLQRLKRALLPVGTIEVVFRHVKVKRVRASQDSGETSKGCKKLGDIPEKALKGRAVSHSIVLKEVEMESRFGTRKYKSNKTVTTTQLGDIFANFKFNYCSNKDLKTLGLIPRTPEPEPAPLPPRSIAHLSLEQAQELLRKYNILPDSQGMMEIKREGENDDQTVFRTTADGDDDECSFVEIRASKRAGTPITLDD